MLIPILLVDKSTSVPDQTNLPLKKKLELPLQPIRE
jgi:hypothetical protein